MQNYILVSVACNPEQAEFLMAELGEKGFEGFLETDTGFDAFLLEGDFQAESLSSILEKYGVSQEQIKVDKVANQNWNEVWEHSFEPVSIGGILNIRAPFHAPDPSLPKEIIIQPKTSFGTGHHETTAAIIGLMLSESLNGKSVLDFGSGTGILSILASKLGASRIFANDIDPWASENILENMELNGIKNIDFQKGDLSVVPEEPYDFILANLNRNILLQCLEKLSSLMVQGGTLFVSGFYLSDLPSIQEEAERCGLHWVRQITRNNWTAAMFQSL